MPFRASLRSSRYYLLIVTALLGAAGGLLLYLLWPWLGIPSDLSRYLQSNGLSLEAWPYFIAYFVLINPWLEEFFWRGCLGSDSKLPVLNDLFFAGYHLMVLAGKVDFIWLIAVFIVLSLAAWFWRQANRWNHGLTSSIVSHFAADLTLILVIYYMAVRI
jgi:hypothetical protein